MPTYFKPLRRKIGVVTLVIACVFAMGWVRSRLIVDHYCCELSKPISGIDCFAFRSHAGELGWTDLTMFHGYVTKGWSSYERNFQRLSDEEYMLAFVTVPYWSIVTPLTLLSAGLLLSKPRAKSAPTHV